MERVSRILYISYSVIRIIVSIPYLIYLKRNINATKKDNLILHDTKDMIFTEYNKKYTIENIKRFDSFTFMTINTDDNISEISYFKDNKMLYTKIMREVNIGITSAIVDNYKVGDRFYSMDIMLGCNGVIICSFEIINSIVSYVPNNIIVKSLCIDDDYILEKYEKNFQKYNTDLRKGNINLVHENISELYDYKNKGIIISSFSFINIHMQCDYKLHTDDCIYILTNSNIIKILSDGNESYISRKEEYKNIVCLYSFNDEIVGLDKDGHKIRFDEFEFYEYASYCKIIYN